MITKKQSSAHSETADPEKGAGEEEKDDSEQPNTIKTFGKDAKTGHS